MKPKGQVDRLVFAELARLTVEPLRCSDAVFVRRADLDVIGTLPTAKEAPEFIQNPDTATQRRTLIDHLLERDEVADYWAMKWGDILRIQAEFPVNLWPNAAQAYQHWVRASIATNKLYVQFVREMLTSGSSHLRVGPVNFCRAVQNRRPGGIAGAMALRFMDARAESWSPNRLANLALFFSQIGYKPSSEWKEERVFRNPLGAGVVAANSARGRAAIAEVGHPSDSTVQPPVPEAANCPLPVAIFPDGARIEMPPNRDPRELIADWLINPGNAWFTWNSVHRVGARHLGSGIIHEPEDIRDDQPLSNPALLACLERELVAARYDLKRLHRWIVNSQTYQLSSMPRCNTPQAAANVASYSLRRLDAEVLMDANIQIPGSSDLCTSPIPEPFT